MERWNELLDDDRFRGLGELSFADARSSALAYVSEVAEHLGSDVLKLLPEFGSVVQFQPSESLVDDLDRRYFEREAVGDIAGSQHAFSAARFASACVFLHYATTFDDLMNAIYEARHAQMASGNPERE